MEGRFVHTEDFLTVATIRWIGQEDNGQEIPDSEKKRGQTFQHPLSSLLENRP